MNCLFLRIAVAVITFVVGAGFHQLALGLTDVALRYDTVVLEERELSTNDSSEVEEGFFDMRYIVISLADSRDVYLGKQFVGNPDDTSRLEAKLQSKFAEFEPARVDVDLKEPRMIRPYPDYKTVYIKASTRSSYGDVVRLIEGVRRAGAQHIGLVPDRRKKGGS
jgi:biopolymer transport protein ExbD